MNSNGKTVLITGGNSGIGAAAAKALALQGFSVVIACRNQDKATRVRDEINRETGNGTVSVLKLDLGSFRSVRECASQFHAQHQRLDVLVNNAGLAPPRKALTEDGFEQQFGVNHLGHYLLTRLLIGLLKQSAPARIIHTSSMMHWLGSINPASFRGETFYNPLGAYGQSKLANILFSNELARRLKNDGVVSNAFHPGGVDTGIYDSYPRPVSAIIKRFLIPAEKGADTAVWLASDPAAAGISGRYFINRKEARTSAKARNPGLAAELWDESARLCGLD
ncbi:MAG: SDR family oxidoreductase [Deltaproteobacteria bacterium]|nr:SDR family oxidoreductase [Deltaproteobacteria bacterium]